MSFDRSPVPGTVYAPNRKAWRKWLAKNHALLEEAWLLFYKVHTDKPSVTYEEAAEEAICYGWIDGKLRRIDDEKHMVRFTPRRDQSAWSFLNVRRAERMIAQGLMVEAGWIQIKKAKEDGRWLKALEEEQKKGEVIIPDDLARALGRNRKARENFEQMAPGYRRGYIRWIEMARKEETRQRRIREVVNRTERNIKPGM